MAMRRHEEQAATVVPIVVRAIDIDPEDAEELPFLKLQALPTDMRPVTSWPNVDEAWTNVARGLRGVIKSIIERRAAAAGDRHATATARRRRRGAGAVAGRRPAGASAIPARRRSRRAPPRRGRPRRGRTRARRPVRCPHAGRRGRRAGRALRQALRRDAECRCRCRCPARIGRGREPRPRSMPTRSPATVRVVGARSRAPVRGRQARRGAHRRPAAARRRRPGARPRRRALLGVDGARQPRPRRRVRPGAAAPGRLGADRPRRRAARAVGRRPAAGQPQGARGARQRAGRGRHRHLDRRGAGRCSKPPPTSRSTWSSPTGSGPPRAATPGWRCSTGCAGASRRCRSSTTTASSTPRGAPARRRGARARRARRGGAARRAARAREARARRLRRGRRPRRLGRASSAAARAGGVSPTGLRARPHECRCKLFLV